MERKVWEYWIGKAWIGFITLGKKGMGMLDWENMNWGMCIFEILNFGKQGLGKMSYGWHLFHVSLEKWLLEHTLVRGWVRFTLCVMFSFTSRFICDHKIVQSVNKFQTLAAYQQQFIYSRKVTCQFRTV